MKTLSVAILSLFLFSCDQEKRTHDKDLPEYYKDIYVTDNTQIIGGWKMCAAYVNGMMTTYNVCLTVSFLNNGSGYVEYPSTASQRFRWTLKKGVLNIVNDKAENTAFPDSFYNAIINRQDQQTNLIVSQTKKDNIFYLSK